MEEGVKERVLHVMANLSVGGAEVHLLALLRGLLATGEVEVALAYYRERPDEARSLAEDFRAAGVKLYDLGLNDRPAELSVRANPAAALGRLAAAIRDFRPDVLHTHLSRVTIGDALLARAVGVNRVVTSVHTNEIYFQHPFWSRALRQAGRFGTRYIAISHAVSAALQTYLGVPERKIDVVYYALDLDEFAAGRATVRAELGAGDDEVLIGTVGRMTEQKGQKYLVEAMPEVLRQFPRARLAIVGHDTGARDALEAQVRSAGLEDRVRLVGYRDDVAAVMSSMDLFVLPSLWEGFGLVLLEAMSLSRPIVATTVDSIPEIVVDGETGFLVPPRDPAALAAAICRMLSDPEMARSMGVAGRRRAETAFSMERMIQETLDVYAATRGV